MFSRSMTSISLKRMSKLFVRISTGLLLLILMWSCARVPGLQEEAISGYIRIPFVRVLLDETGEEVTVSSDGSFAIECLSAGQQEVYYSSQPVKIRGGKMLVSVFNKNGAPISERMDEINIIPRGNNNRTRLGDKRYRGILRFLPNGTAIRVINVVYMEDYLRGVVPPEIGPRQNEEIEAVKAQAVAARTYAMAHLKQYSGAPYDMKSSIMDQVYQGVTVENDLVNKAINGTEGVVIMHQDKMINAYYHSTCGGRTDDIEAVWDRKEEPYLKSVEDNAACSWSKYYSWREVFTEKQLRGRIEQYLASDRGRDLRISPITDIIILDRTPGGRIRTLQVRTATDLYSFHKDRIRWVIGRTSDPDLILPSDRFTADIVRDGSGGVASVTFNGQGYGHGVGMCQCGAIGHSREGWTYDRILKHYYTNVELRKLY